MKKIIILLVIVLFVGLCLQPTYANNIMENNPPYEPSNIYPCGEAGIPIIVNLSWDSGDPDIGDTVSYDIYLYIFGPPQKIATVGPYPWNHTRIVYGPIELNEYHTYYMKICAYDNHGAYIEGPICSFHSGANHPPTYPIIDGPTSGRKNKIYEYTFMSTDPENHSIWYHVKWGDGLVGLTDLYPSGEEVTISHSWDSYGEMQIEARAIDEHYEPSGWSTWTITIPRDKATNNMLFWRLINRLPLLEGLLTFLTKNILF